MVEDIAASGRHDDGNGKLRAYISKLKAGSRESKVQVGPGDIPPMTHLLKQGHTS